MNFDALLYALDNSAWVVFFDKNQKYFVNEGLP